VTPTTGADPLHRPQPGEYFLEETDSEYLLFIHYTEKARASGIQGRKWDSERKCWVYPKNQRSYYALLAEFGDDLIGVGPGIQAAKSEPPTAEPVAEPRSDYLTTELANARVLLEQREIELNQARSANSRLRERIGQLEKRLTDSSAPDAAGRVEGVGPDPLSSILPVAIAATGGDPVFEEVVTAIPMDRRFPIEIAGKMTWAFRRLVGDDHGSQDLYPLLKEAEDRQLLSAAALNCAHVIRMQRNLLAHPDESGPVDERSMIGRIALCLFAAAIVWPELPE
jgi:hypothetical protein